MFLKVLCKGFFLITILFLLLAPVQPVFAGDIDILVVVPATGQKFYTYGYIDDATWVVYAPLTDVARAVEKVDIQWEPEEERLTLEMEDYWCECWVGDTKATVNGDSVYMEAPPFVYYSRTYVPVKFIGEALGRQAEWDYTTNTLTLR